MKDLSTIGGTLTNKFEFLMSEMVSMDFLELQNSVKEILNDTETVSASQETRKKWLYSLSTKKNKNDLMTMITNLYLAGSGLSGNKRN